MNYCRNNISIHAFTFLCSLLSFTKYENILGFNPTSSSMAAPAVSSFILPIANLFDKILT